MEINFSNIYNKLRIASEIIDCVRVRVLKILHLYVWQNYLQINIKNKLDKLVTQIWIN